MPWASTGRPPHGPGAGPSTPAPAPPPAPRGDAVDRRHGQVLPDPWRRLEDPHDPDVRCWLAAHDARARAALDALPGREVLRRSATRWSATGDAGVPERRGGRTFALRRAPGAEHPRLEVVEPAGPTRVLLDPLALDPSGATVVDGWWPGPAGRRVAVALSEPGHASRLRLLDAGSGALLEGPVERTALSPAAWLPGGDELLWVRQDDARSRVGRRVWRHRVGEPDADRLVDGDGLHDDPARWFGLHASPDGSRVVIDAAAGTAPGDGLWLVDTAEPTARAVAVLHPRDGVRARARIAADGRLWIVTTHGAPRGRLCVADPDDPRAWRELVGEVPGTVLDAARLVAGVAVLVRGRDGVDELHLHDPDDGAPLDAIALPGVGTVTGLGVPDDPADPRLAVGWTSEAEPPRVLWVDVRTGRVDDPDRPARTPPRPRRLPGTRVLVTAGPAGSDGPRPTVLTGYGGFSHVAGPAFSVLAAAWVSAGGVWARAVLRGGGEDGDPGHDAGRGAHLRAGTDDLLDAADALVAAGVTRRDRLALLGTSHGGLRVAQAVVARPDAVTAAVCASPLADLVRAELAGIGRAWRTEYGRPEDPGERAWLVTGSPVHTVLPGALPRVLVTASDADTRVDPAHARKLVAALTWADPRDDRVLLRRESDTGHGPRSASRTAAWVLDVLAFLADATGLVVPADAAADPCAGPPPPRP